MGEQREPRAFARATATFIGVLVALAAAIAAASSGAVEVGAPAVAPTPVNTGPPALSGTPVAGGTLTCSPGKWTNDPTSFSYIWLLDGVVIPGQTASIYVVQPADQGHAISCQVSASNGGGDYTIGGLANGAYRVKFGGEESGPNYQEQYFNGRALSKEADLVSVTAPNTTANVNAEMRAGGQIAGRVIDAVSKQPLANIFVCAEQKNAGECAETGTNGEYAISGLPEGSYIVSFSASSIEYRTEFYNQKAAPGEATPVAVKPGTATPNINAEMLPFNEGGQITGTVTKEIGGAPVAGLRVCAFPAGEEFLEFLEFIGNLCASTNANGEYAITGLGAGEYNVHFTGLSCVSTCTHLNYVPQFYNGAASQAQAQKVPVTAGKTTPAVNAAMAPGGQVTGTVTAANGGAPLAGVEVCASPVGSSFEFVVCEATQANGEYTLSGLAGKEYVVQFLSGEDYVSQYWNNKATYAEATHVKVVAPTVVAGINAQMQTGGDISGRVTDASSHAPIAGVSVCSVDAGVEFRSCTTTNNRGEYTIRRMGTGSYEVRSNPEAENENHLPQVQKGVSVVAGSVTSVNPELAPGGQISGRVTDAVSHAGVAKVRVCAESMSGGRTRCASTVAASAAASAQSSAIAVPVADFTMTQRPVFDARAGNLDFFFDFPTAGRLNWALYFRNADVGFADSLGISLGEGATAEASRKKGGKARRCKRGQTKRRGRCKRLLVPFSSGSESVAPGIVEVKVHADSAAIKALKSGHALHVSGVFSFQSALGGPVISHTESATVKPPRKKHRRGKGKKR